MVHMCSLDVIPGLGRAVVSVFSPLVLVPAGVNVERHKDDSEGDQVLHHKSANKHHIWRRVTAVQPKPSLIPSEEQLRWFWRGKHKDVSNCNSFANSLV